MKTRGCLKRELKETKQEKNAVNKKHAAAHFKNSLHSNQDSQSKHAKQENYFEYANSIDMICCVNPVPITTGITQTNASLQTHPPITLKTKPLKSAKVPSMEVIIVASAQDTVLVIILTAEVATRSKRYHPKPNDRFWSGSHLLGLRHSSYNNKMYIKDEDKQDSG